MALDAAALRADLLAWMDTAADDVQAGADGLGGLVGDFAVDVEPESVAPAVPTATTALKTAIAAALTGTDPVVTATNLEAAFLTFATAVGAGMAPAFTATPPGPVGFAVLLAAAPESREDAADDWRDAIDAWLQTGTATPSGGGPPVLWS